MNRTDLDLLEFIVFSVEEQLHFFNYSFNSDEKAKLIALFVKLLKTIDARATKKEVVEIVKINFTLAAKIIKKEIVIPIPLQEKNVQEKSIDIKALAELARIMDEFLEQNKRVMTYENKIEILFDMYKHYVTSQNIESSNIENYLLEQMNEEEK